MERVESEVRRRGAVSELVECLFVGVVFGPILLIVIGRSDLVPWPEWAVMAFLSWVSLRLAHGRREAYESMLRGEG